MTTSQHDRWVVVETTGRLWLHERVGGEVGDRVVTRDELLARYPALYVQLRLSNNRDAPFVVTERQP